MGFPGRARATEEPEAHDDPTKNFAASPIGRSSAGYLTIVGRADIWPDSVQVPTGLLFLRLPTSGLPSCAQLPAERDAVGEECRPYGGPPESRAEHYCDFMVDRATPNLPSRDFDTTAAFFAGVGFATAYRDSGWMILSRGEVSLEFFPFPELDPATSAFSCCLRLDDVTAFFEECRAAGIPQSRRGWPRVHRPSLEDSGLRIGALIDPDCTLLRLIQNP